MRKNLITLLVILGSCMLILLGIGLSKKIKNALKPGLRVNIEKIDNFSINSKEGSFVFVKSPGGWNIEISEDGKTNSYTCDPDLMKQFFDKIKNTDLMDIVTENKERFAEFQVDDVKGARIKLYNGKKLLESFIVGTMSMANYENIYFRFENKNQVWLTRKGLEPWLLIRKADNWRDMSIIKEDGKSPITQVELKYLGKPKDTILLTRVSDYWLIDKTDKKANQEKMKQFYNTLSKLKADGIAEKNIKLGKINLEMTVKFGDKAVTLGFGDKSGAEQLFQKNNTEPTFRMYDFKFNYLKPSRQDLSQ